MTISASKDPATTDQVATVPRMLHHTAYITHDTAATVDFYTRVLGMKLVSTVIDDAVPSTGEPFPYIHLFFELGDGSTLAFFESIGLPPLAPWPHPAYRVFNHLALDVGTREQVDCWATHLRRLGIDCVGPVDHGIIYSVYFYDPNDIRLELTATTDAGWKDHGKQAAIDVAEWTEIKNKVAAEGNASAAIEWIKERRARHKLASPVETA